MKSPLPVRSTGRLFSLLLLLGYQFVWAQSVPDPIQNLRTIDVTAGSVSLMWTAPNGTDGAPVASYRLGLSQTPITAENFDSTEHIPITQPPQAPGTTETFSVYGLTAGTTYYVAIKSANFMSDYSDISNVVQFTTKLPPAIQVEPTAIQDSLITGESTSKLITLHNTGLSDLEVSFSYGWIVKPVDPTSQTISAGDSLVLELTLYAGGLSAGTHREEFEIYCNDPDRSVIKIPVTLHVTENGSPIAVITGIIDDSFGEVYVGDRSVPSWTYVVNMGSEPLIISEVTSSNPDIWVDELAQPDTLQTSEQYFLLYQYIPTSVGPVTSEISVHSNDPVNPVLNMHISGVGVESPVQFVLDDAFVSDTLYSGESSSKVVMLTNEGFENLEFMIIDWELPSFADVSPRFGTVAPGESIALEVFFNSAGQDAGVYNFEITIENNDPRYYGAFFLPAQLTVKAPEVKDFNLVNSKTGVVLTNSQNQITLDVAHRDISLLTIQANTFPARSGSVSFSMDGVFSNTDNTRPYAVNNWLLPALTGGQHTLTAKAYERSSAQGKGGAEKGVTFSVINSATIADFDLVNTSGIKIMDVENGSVIDISQVGSSSVNIIANPSVSSVKSVKFKLNGTTSRIDNRIPFALKGNSNEDTFWPLKVGSYTLTAFPYVQYYGWGVEGLSKTISFRVVNGAVPTLANARSASSVEDENEEVQLDEGQEFMTLYPVPVRDELVVKLSKPVEGTVSIINLQGQVVLSNADPSNDFDKYVISTTGMGLRSGVYIVQFRQSSGKLIAKKFFKE